MILEEFNEAIVFAAEQTGVNVKDFSIGVRWPDETSQVGWHVYVVELDRDVAPGFAEEFGRHVDQCLADGSKDYATHRSGGFGMGMPQIMVAPQGTFAAWMKARGRLGGQNKVPRIIKDTETFATLTDMLNS